MRITHAWRKARALAIAAALVCGAGIAGSLATPEAAHAMENGTTVPKGKYPFYTDVPGCGGALVAPTWVITAGHCGRVQQVGSTQVAVNTYNYSERSSDVRSTVREIVYPEQVPGVPDVALLRVDPVTSIRPIRLADTFIPEGSVLQNAGMGAGSGGLLKESSFTVLRHETQTARVIAKPPVMETRNLPGDSGSPYFTVVNGEPRLVGVVSVVIYWSNGWTETGVVDVTSTPALRDWFARTTGNSVAPLKKTVTLRSETSGGYVSARLDVNSWPLDAWVGRSRALAWEEFDLQYNADATVSIRSKANGWYVGAPPGGERLTANRVQALEWEKFIPVRNPNGSVSLRAMSNGKYIAVVTVGPDQIMTATGAAGARETQFWFSSL